MISAKNYAAQCERDLLLLRKSFTDDARRRMYAELAIGINKSVHFATSDNGIIFDSGLKGLCGINLRLPYPKITVEYAITKVSKELPEDFESAYGKHIMSTKALVLVNEIEGDELDIFIEDLKNNSFGRIVLSEPMMSWIHTTDRVVQFFPFAGFKDAYWSPGSVQVILNSEWKAEDGSMQLFYLPLDEIPPGPMDGTYLSHLCKVAFAHTYGVLEFLEALTCKNVKQSIHQEARKNNDKWVRLGKLPMYETKVLTIDTTEKEYIGSSGGSGRSHASPRQHLRRGHIRKLESGNIWVNSCVVGSAENGRLDKSYKVK